MAASGPLALRSLDRAFLLRAGVTLLVLVVVEVARVLYVMGRSPLGDAAALYLSVLLGGLFALPSDDGMLDEAAGVVGFLLAPVAVVAGVGLLALPFAIGGLEPRLGIAVLAGGIAASLALLLATLLVPAEAWRLPPDRDPLARVARGAGRSLRTLFLPGAVAAAGFVLGSFLTA